jgi:hypothetical protein
MTEFLNLLPKLLDPVGVPQLILRLGIDVFFVSFVVLFVYARRHGKNEYLFTYVMFNLLTFALAFLMIKVTGLTMGFGFGLFAVFGILRYRTEPIPIHELTYLFVVIGLGLMNAVVTTINLEVLLINVVITGMVAMLEYVPLFGSQKCIRITYDDLELVRNGDSAALIADLNQRTGLDIKRVRIESVDLLRETSRITIFFHG